tara:strand:- start:209 stop:439 length:231 start_codon:yes stop_codon:yes gene_type:complete
MKKKSLAETHPEVAKQRHPTKNVTLTPYEITSGTGKKVWWKCDKGNDHEWFTSPNSRHIFFFFFFFFFNSESLFIN